MRETLAPDHLNRRSEIEQQTAEFLARGGKIKTLPTGRPAAVSHNEKCEEFRLQMSEQIRTAEARK